MFEGTLVITVNFKGHVIRIRRIAGERFPFAYDVYKGFELVADNFDFADLSAALVAAQMDVNEGE